MYLNLDEINTQIDESIVTAVSGHVKEVVGLVIHATPLVAPIGSFCEITTNNGSTISAGIVGFKDGSTLLMTYDELEGVSRFDKVRVVKLEQNISVGHHLLGRVIDGLGNPIDGEEIGFSLNKRKLFEDAPDPLKRPKINEPLPIGVRAIDSFLSVGKGQRMGIFAGTGVGKSVTMGMIASNTKADVVVIALVGERGREVREFLENDLGEETLKKSVLVVATGEKPALQRVRSVFVATAVAEYFRDEGKDVLLIMDSITRVAMAQREIGLSAGEPPSTKGYPPSVFNLLPKFLERAGRNEKGSITGIYTVLLEADDINDPIGDAARGILDGHIVLDRSLASKGHYPAIDILGSISRVAPNILPEKILKSQQRIRALMASYQEAEDLINIGAYVRGTNKEVDLAIEMNQSIKLFLQQGMNDKAEYDDSMKKIQTLAAMAASQQR